MKEISEQEVADHRTLTDTGSTEIFNNMLSDLFRTKQELVKNLALLGAMVFSQDVKYLLLQ